MAASLFGFLVGSLSGLHFQIACHLDYSIILFCAALSFCFRKTKAAPFLLLLSGFLWGAKHHAPSPETASGLSVMASAPFLPQPDQVFIGDKNHVFLARGDSELGNSGQISGGMKNALGLTTTRFTPEESLQNKTYFFAYWGTHFSSLLENRIKKQPKPLQPWFYGFFLGQNQAMGKDQINLFKCCGLMHLLVVSGLHMGIIAWIVSLLLAWPFRALYVFRLISPKAWIELKPIIDLSLILVLLVYAYTVGLATSAQRSILLVLVNVINHSFSFFWPLKNRMLISGFLQGLLFPVGFFSIATLMTWLTYLSVVHLGLKTKSYPFFSGVWHQVQITFLAAAFFGQISVLSLFTNLVFTPVIFLISICGLINLSGVAEVLHIDEILWVLQLFYIHLIERIGQLTQNHPYLYLDLSEMNLWATCATLAFATWSALNTLRFLAKEPQKAS